MENIAERVINIIGGQEAVAQGCGITQQAVSLWVKKGKIATEHILTVYELIGKKIPLYELSPTIYPKHIFNM